MYYYSRAWYVIGSDCWVSSNNTWEWLSPLSGHIFHSLVYFHSTSPVLSFLSGILFNISFILYLKFWKVVSPVICKKKFPQDFPDYTHGHLQAVLFHVVPNLGSHCAFWEEISKNIGNMYRIWTCVCGHICVHYSWQSLRWTYVWNDARLFKKIAFPKRFILASNLSIAFYVVKFHGMSNILLCGCTKMIGAIMIINIGTNQSQGCAIVGQY